METKTDKKYNRLSPRSLMLYEMAKRRAERATQALDLRQGGLNGDGSSGPDHAETDQSAGMSNRH